MNIHSDADAERSSHETWQPMAMKVTRKRDWDKSEAILAAALSLFCARGFHGVTVPEIAAKAKLGTGTIYRYFKSKEALVNVLYQSCKQDMVHALFDDFPTGVPFRDQFHALWSRLFAYAQRAPVALAFLDLHHHGEYLNARSRALIEKVEADILMLIERGRAAGVTKDIDARVLMAIAYGAFLGLVKGSFTANGLTLSLALSEQTAQIVWEVLAR
jgi:AcrR family transcriptional regulator